MADKEGESNRRTPRDILGAVMRGGKKFSFEEIATAIAEGQSIIDRDDGSWQVPIQFYRLLDEYGR